MVVLIQFLASAASLGILLTVSPGSRPDAPGEYEVKAAFLYRFASFVQWPDENKGSPPCIGVLGQDPFGRVLDLANRKSSGRGYGIVRSRRSEDVAGCRIVFISSSERRDLPSILRNLSDRVLTVSDMPEFCERGGMIGFELAEQRVRLHINLEAALRARLLISSKLLSVAKLVEGATH